MINKFIIVAGNTYKSQVDKQVIVNRKPCHTSDILIPNDHFDIITVCPCFCIFISIFNPIKMG